MPLTRILFPSLCSRGSQGCRTSPRAASDTEAEHVPHRRVNLPFLPALPINAGILWVVQNPVIIPFLLSKMEFSSPATAESTQSEFPGNAWVKFPWVKSLS